MPYGQSLQDSDYGRRYKMPCGQSLQDSHNTCRNSRLVVNEDDLRYIIYIRWVVTIL